MKSKKAAEAFALCIEKHNRVGAEFEQKMSESSQVSSPRFCLPKPRHRKLAFSTMLSSKIETSAP